MSRTELTFEYRILPSGSQYRHWWTQYLRLVRGSPVRSRFVHLEISPILIQLILVNSQTCWAKSNHRLPRKTRSRSQDLRSSRLPVCLSMRKTARFHPIAWTEYVSLTYLAVTLIKTQILVLDLPGRLRGGRSYSRHVLPARLPQGLC